MQLLIAALITSLQIIFIHILFWDGMLLAPIKYWLHSLLPLWFRKPLYDCLICMTSVWGIALYFLEWNHQFNIIWFLFAVGGINTIIYGIIGNADDYNGEKFVKDNELN